MKKKILTSLLLQAFVVMGYAQERIVKIDFESGSFINNPSIPFDEPFAIMGETSGDIEFVKVNIAYEGKDFNLHSFVWNRNESNTSENFNILVPPILKSNTNYDFEIITYKLLSKTQKTELLENVEEKVRFLLENNIYFDGKHVNINKPKTVYEQLSQLINESFQFHESKNLIPIQSPSSLVLDELKKQSDFKFSRFFKKVTRVEKDEIANELIDKKVEHLTRLITSELAPFINSEVVQHYRQTNVKSVETDKEQFSLPINVGMYAWSKSINVNNIEKQNINFTPGAGITVPFNNKSRFSTKTRIFDSFGASAGVLFQPVVDANGNEYVTPGVNLPVYAGLGFRIFNVLRFNAGTLILGEKGTQNFTKLSLSPTVGLALELNVWMGIKK
ncbi:MAG: hypothetical protein WEC59_13025 [Salibacteraceae bacterium]